MTRCGVRPFRGWFLPDEIGLFAIYHCLNSFHSGFIEAISSSFLCRDQLLICFSRSMAWRISVNSSIYTTLCVLYFAVNPSKSWFRCWLILFCKSEVTPVYSTSFFQFVSIYTYDFSIALSFSTPWRHCKVLFCSPLRASLRGLVRGRGNLFIWETSEVIFRS